MDEIMERSEKIQSAISELRDQHSPIFDKFGPELDVKIETAMDNSLNHEFYPKDKRLIIVRERIEKAIKRKKFRNVQFIKEKF